MKILIKKIIPVVLALTLFFIALPNKAYADYTFYIVPSATSITNAASVQSNTGCLALWMPYAITGTAPTDEYYFKLTCVEDSTSKLYGYTGTSGVRVPVENIPITISSETADHYPAGAIVTVIFTDVEVGKHYNIEIVKTSDGGASFTTYAAGFAQDIEITLGPAGGGITTEDDDTPYWQPAVDMINALGLYNAPKSYVFEKGDALPIQVMQALKNNPDVTLDFKYTYEDKAYEVSILGKDAIVDPEITWYGPLWLAEHYGNAKTVSSNGTYKVVSGDTLGQIAKKYNTTVDALLKLNPDITNKDMIYIGQTIKY